MENMERKTFDWNDPKNLRERAWNSVKEFFGKEEAEHPLSPDTVARETQATTPALNADDNHGERLYRSTQQRALNDNPTIWPG